MNYEDLLKPISLDRLERQLQGGAAEADAPQFEVPLTLESNEQSYIEYVLLQCGGNVTQAARWLGLHRQSLQRKLKRFNLRAEAWALMKPVQAP